MVIRSAAKDDVAPGNYHHVAKTVGGQLELFGGVSAVHFGHTGKIVQKMENVKFAAGTDFRRQMNDGKRTERTVMDDIGICDGQDNTEARAVFFCQFAFQINDVGGAIGLLLGVHAMIGSDADESAECNETTQLLVDGGVQIQRLRFFGPELVLDEVSGGEIKKIGEIMLEQFDAGAEEVGAGVG